MCYLNNNTLYINGYSDNLVINLLFEKNKPIKCSTTTSQLLVFLIKQY